MRTTVTLADDGAAEVEQLRRERGLGVSEAINELAQRGMATPSSKPPAFRQETFDMQARIDWPTPARSWTSWTSAPAQRRQ